MAQGRLARTGSHLRLSLTPTVAWASCPLEDAWADHLGMLMVKSMLLCCSWKVRCLSFKSPGWWSGYAVILDDQITRII
jgi:hypothetical protein